MGTDRGEIRAAATCLGIAAGFMLLVLASGRIPMLEFLNLLRVYLHALAALTMVVGAIALFFVCGQRRLREGELPSPIAISRAFLDQRWQRDRLLGLLTPMLVAAMMLAAFNAFKQILLPAAGFGFDPMFAAWDRALFLGVDPWVLTHRWFGSLAATRLIDSFYHGWFVPMTLGIVICAFLKDAELRVQYVLAYLLCWIVIGTLLAWLLPAGGPCFYGEFAGSPDSFAPLMETLRAQDAALVTRGEAGLSALRNQAALLTHFDSGHLAMGGGISAMPSMHNALAVLFALGGMRIHRGLGVAMWVYAVLIWIGSVHLGWHYAIDGIFAALLTVAAWAVSGRWARSLLKPKPALNPIWAAAE